ncbi:MAG: ABC transporter ATP-binding protein [Candidatus Zixiibacteriota bacterium]
MSFASVTSLSKSYGDIKAVEDFSFEVNQGEIFALVGPDGAGKTTIMRSLCNLITRDAGEIIIKGMNVARDFEHIKMILGYMPQIFSLYPDLSVKENLKFYGGIYGIVREAFDKKAEYLYGFSNLKPFANRRAGALSGGMKQKLALSCSLIHEPELLILDEPTTGVDPLSRRQFWEILLELKQKGATIIVSTPYMDEVAKADRACFIFNGKKLVEGTPESLPDLFEGKLYWLDREPAAALLEKLESIDGLDARRFGAGIHLSVGPDDDVERHREALTAAGIEMSELKPIRADLEDCFIQFMERSL